MLKLSGADIRKRFLAFFEAQGHLVVPSASLIPSNPTVMLTPAGMLPFVPIFLGIEPSTNPPRATSVQKCARVSGKASDLSYVGRTARHHTFFEMLGNFSFGDYFKADAIRFAWNFVTQSLEMPVDRLWVSVFHTDEEARQIWHQQMGVPLQRIAKRDEKDNFWGPPGPTGPCGPCSEIFYDQGAHLACGPTCDFVTCECDRYVEIWNLVFMELFQDASGKRTPLEKKNVDTGMGLERLATILQGVDNTFETDLLFPIVKKMADYTGHRYKQDAEDDVALKIVADHTRCVAFAIADGIIPSNEGRGYIIRMILRRGIRYAKKLGMKEPMLFKLVSVIRDIYQEAYPELKQSYEQIVETVKAEEKRFLETLERGSRLLEEAITELTAQNQTVLSGEAAFKLYDTYGFPLELTQEWVQEHGLTVDEAGFETAMAAQKERARSAQGDKTIVADQTYAEILKEYGPTPFLGYDTLDADATVLALLQNGQRVEQVRGANQPFEVILSQTPFYGESGGQVGDKGILYVQNGQQAQTVVVKDTQKVGDLFVHHCLYDQGDGLQVGQTVRAEVRPELRMKTMRHHTATHLLHAALKHVLGSSVSQAGSYVGPDSARFDFSFGRGVKPEELQQIEVLVNRWIFENTERQTQLMDPESAKAAGAIAMFNEKYGDTVRVVGFGEVSKELCGGTHVDRLGDIGLFKILSESAIAAGVRRIEMVAGEPALYQVQGLERDLQQTASLLNVAPREVAERVEKMLQERKLQEKHVKALQEKLAVQQLHALLAAYPDETTPLITAVSIENADALKFLAETLVQKRPNQVVVLGANIEGKALFVASVPEAQVKAGIKAGELVKIAATVCEGGGGGKPHFAQAGGKLGLKVPDALSQVNAHLSGALSRL